MQVAVGIYLLALTTAILGLIVRDAVRSTVPLVSLRNAFLIGIVLFQTLSGAVTALTGFTEKGAELSFPAASGFVFAVVITLFVAAFFLLYGVINVETFAARHSRIRCISASRLCAAGVVVLFIGVGLRFGAAGVPYLGVLLPQMAAGALAAAVTLLAYAWVRNVWNPLTGALALFGVIVSAMTLLVDAFGRRELLGVGMAVIWGCFQSRWKHGSASLLATRLALAALVAFIPIVLFSASRTSLNDRRTAVEQVERMGDIDFRAIEEATIGMLSGQFAGGISMWVIETRPGDFSVDPLHSLVYFVTLPLPRDYWPNKPEGLGLLLVDQALLNGVSAGHSWGPGLVGHLIHDVVFVSLPLYAAIIAVVLKYLDTRVRQSADDPLALACLGAALGQVLGMPRGDLGLFAFNMAAALAGAKLATWIGATAIMPSTIDRDWPGDVFSSQHRLNDESESN